MDSSFPGTGPTKRKVSHDVFRVLRQLGGTIPGWTDKEEVPVPTILDPVKAGDVLKARAIKPVKPDTLKNYAQAYTHLLKYVEGSFRLRSTLREQLHFTQNVVSNLYRVFNKRSNFKRCSKLN